MAMDYHAIVIGTGFGANVVASNLAPGSPTQQANPKYLCWNVASGGLRPSARSRPLLRLMLIPSIRRETALSLLTRNIRCSIGQGPIIGGAFWNS